MINYNFEGIEPSKLPDIILFDRINKTKKVAGIAMFLT